MYLFQKQGREYQITDKDFEDVRDQLVAHACQRWISVYLR